GMAFLQNDASFSSAAGQDFPSDAVKNLTGATNITGASSSAGRATFLSYFLRANYSYKDKYLVSASLREDGSSRFAPKHQYGWYPSASVGWVLSEEDFLKDNNALSFLKLRASYGLTGNAEIPDFRYLSLYGVTNYPGLPGFSPSQLGNPNLKWEK